MTPSEQAAEYALKWFGDQDACNMACARGAEEGFTAGAAHERARAGVLVEALELIEHHDYACVQDALAEYKRQRGE